jgi:hypothetical protein
MLIMVDRVSRSICRCRGHIPLLPMMNTAIRALDSHLTCIEEHSILFRTLPYPFLSLFYLSKIRQRSSPLPLRPCTRRRALGYDSTLTAFILDTECFCHFLFPFLLTLRVTYLFLLTLGSSVLNAPRLALSKQGNRGPLSLSIFVCVLLDPRPADKTTTRANTPWFALLLAGLVRFPFPSPSAHLYQVDWTTSEATNRLRERASDPFCNVAVSMTLLLRPPRLLMETRY